MKKALKAAARALFGDYAVYHIASVDLKNSTAAPASQAPHIVAVDRSRILASPDSLIREQADYAGEGAHAFACLEGDRIVALCFYWHDARYAARNFWPLQAGEAKLVQIVTVPDRRGRGLAPALIAQSGARMRSAGFRRLFARIWHSNHPSLAAFERAGWSRVATVVEVHPFGLPKTWRWVRRR